MLCSMRCYSIPTSYEKAHCHVERLKIQLGLVKASSWKLEVDPGDSRRIVKCLKHPAAGYHMRDQQHAYDETGKLEHSRVTFALLLESPKTIKQRGENMRCINMFMLSCLVLLSCSDNERFKDHCQTYT